MMKQLIYNLLCNTLTGQVIYSIFDGTIPNLRYRSYRFDLTRAAFEKRLAASIFFGFYESAEIRLLEKHFHGELDVIELGASCGVVSSHIISKFRDARKQLISVEANEALFDSWKANTNRHNRANALNSFLHNAVYYQSEWVNFMVSRNTTESKISAEVSPSSQAAIKTITLDDVVEKYALEQFLLVCDIEGAELQIFLNEKKEILDHCAGMIIELHDTADEHKKFTVNEVALIIQNHGFLLEERQGNVFYFVRKSAR
jgi:FkbM family methyltransferase